MRFAYIDSQGSEINIPSVDALAVRIELGAIGPETALYDAQADRWGPAASHEIFHALARDVSGEAFLVPSPPGPDPRPESGASVEAPAGPALDTSGQSVPSRPAAPTAADLGLTLVPVEPTSGTGTGSAGGTDRGKRVRPPPPEAPDGSDLRFELAPPASASQGGEPEQSAPSAPTDAHGEVFERPLPFSSRDPRDGPADPGEAAFDFGMPPAGAPLDMVEGDASSRPPGGPARASDDPFAGPFGLEQPLSFGAEGAAEPGFGGGLELEPPMSDFDPSAPPAWMEQNGPGRGGFSLGDEPVLDFQEGAVAGSVSSSGAAGGLAPGREEARLGSERGAPPPRSPSRAAPSRSGPRRPTHRRSARGPLLAALTLVLLGVGGWYGWNLFVARDAPPTERPAVVIPSIPDALETPMREFADRAVVGMYAAIEGTVLGPDALAAPSDEWLAGIYLGNASRYDDVERFWQAIGAFADRLRADETRAFHEAYVALVAASDFDPEAAALMTERADSGFMATRGARLESYGLLRSLADAALALHDYLTLHEADIAYTPARGFGGNPVEEAVPATAAIGREMWDRVGAITTALDRLGTLDRVTRDRLATVLLARIQAVGIE